ncbi:MAG: phosphotransferase family protein [Betaproteobacteria bacterium]|nr:phosphotransferase family protein [Betaproteobacteria bacterium]
MQTALPDFDGLLNWENLNAWMESRELPGHGPVIAVQRLAGGTQNNLFLMTRGDARFVLRRPPLHPRANSNATMLREARVLQALAGSPVPHPRFLAACDDTGVIGVCFYLMAPLDGFSPRGLLPAHYARERSWRRQMGVELIQVAAAIASVDHETAGLADYGKPEHWHERQVDRWRSQLEGYLLLPGYTEVLLPHVDEVCRWLGDNIPANQRIGVIHGDFQFSNAMYAHTEPRIVGMIDWELSSLGDPVLDLCWALARWVEDGDPEGETPFLEPWDGFPSRAELMGLYGELTGRDLSEIAWFQVLASYKMGCVFEGTYARALSGQAPMAIGERLHRTSVWQLRKSRQLIGTA